MEATKIVEISKRILTLVQTGMSVQESFDAVLGVGTYDKLVGELYDALRAKGSK